MKTVRAVAVSLFLLLSFLAPAFAEELRVQAKDPQAEYERVWSAAIDTLYEMGFPISFMSKGDGYLVTENKVFHMKVRTWEASGYRARVVLKFMKAGDSIVVRIGSGAEKLDWSKSSLDQNILPFYLWEPAGSNAKLEKSVKEGISSRL